MKRDIHAALNRLSSPQENTPAEDRPLQKVVEVTIKKTGRPASFNNTEKRVRLGGSLPESTMRKMKMALADKFSNVHRTQDELINAAILKYIE